MEKVFYLNVIYGIKEGQSVKYQKETLGKFSSLERTKERAAELLPAWIKKNGINATVYKFAITEEIEHQVELHNFGIGVNISSVVDMAAVKDSLMARIQNAINDVVSQYKEKYGITDVRVHQAFVKHTEITDIVPEEIKNEQL